MSRKTRPAQPATDPRVPGGRYLSGYWCQEYTVTNTETRHGVLWLTCQWHPWTPGSHPRVSRQWEDEPARTTTHCTAWDACRDVIIDVPTCMHGVTSPCGLCGTF